MFVGIGSGALLAGKISDKIGRRGPLFYGALGLFFSAFISVFSPDFEILLLFRFLYGFFMGFTIPLAVAYMSEIFPKDCRGKYYIIMG